MAISLGFLDIERSKMFYHYRQNNSGGGFDCDDNVHMNVIIEANSANQANNKAKSIGIYFDGVGKNMDCDCCGDRWSCVDDDDGTEVPSMYGTSLNEFQADSYFVKDGVKAIVYYADGRKEVVK